MDNSPVGSVTVNKEFYLISSVLQAKNLRSVFCFQFSGIFFKNSCFSAISILREVETSLFNYCHIL